MTDATMEALRVATYNVHSGVGADGVYDIARIADVIGEVAADVVAVQEIEVNTAVQRTRLWSSEHSSDQVAELASQAGFGHHVFGAATRCRATGWFSESHGEGEGLFGNAILSRHPIVDTRELAYRPYGSKSPRSAVAGLIEVPRVGRIWVVCTHLGMCLHGGEQQQQAGELATWALALGEGQAAVLVLGDFNSLPWFAASSRMREGGFLDAHAHAGRGCGFTFPAQCCGPCVPCGWTNVLPFFRLDYCYVHSCGAQLTVVTLAPRRCADGPVRIWQEDVSVLKSVASDHWPLVVQLGCTTAACRE